MHVPINLVLLLALPASHALVIPEPNLQSADLALTAGKVINAVPVVNTVHVETRRQLDGGQKQEEGSTHVYPSIIKSGTASDYESRALAKRDIWRTYGFKFTDVPRAAIGGVELVWTFVKPWGKAKYVNFFKVLNPTSYSVLVRLVDSVTFEVLEAITVGPRGSASIKDPHTTAKMNLEMFDV